MSACKSCGLVRVPLTRGFCPSCYCNERRSEVEEAWRRTPSVDELIGWEADGGCHCSGPCECWVEVDCTACPNGYPSWLIVLGLV